MAIWGIAREDDLLELRSKVDAMWQMEPLIINTDQMLLLRVPSDTTQENAEILKTMFEEKGVETIIIVADKIDILAVSDEKT